MSDKGFRVEIPVNIKRDRPTGKAAKREPQHEGQQDAVPRLASLLALAHKWEGMVRRGETSCGGIARRLGLSSARVSQVCGLTLLAPAIQKSMLDEQPRTLSRAALRALSNEPKWSRQKRSIVPDH